MSEVVAMTIRFANINSAKNGYVLDIADDYKSAGDKYVFYTMKELCGFLQEWEAKKIE